MDEQRQRLERAWKASPDDPSVARAYQSALLRTGERQAVRELYTWKFECPLRWDALATTDDDKKKHCARCDRDVHLVNTMPQFRELVSAGHCVAIAEGRAQSFMDGLVDEPRVHVAKDPEAPCVVLVTAPPRQGGVTMGVVQSRS